MTDLPRISDKKLCPSVKWLTEELLPKLASWMGARSKELGASKSQWRPPLPNSLINEDQYGRLYRHLKGKYGRRIAQVCGTCVYTIVRHLRMTRYTNTY